jgi:predicted DNA binding CopG/RHH family protein
MVQKSQQERIHGRRAAMKKQATLPPIRLSNQLREALEKKATAKEMSLSEYVRWLILKDVEGGYKNEV